MTERPLRFFFVLAFAITWGAGGLGLALAAIQPAAGFTSSNPLYYIAAYGPTLAALIVTGRTSGLDGIRRLLLRALPTRGGLKWYLAVLIGYPALLLLAGRLAGPETPPSLATWPKLLQLLAVTLLKDPGPLGEEFGWRGVALPGLLQRWSPLGASLVLGGIWGAWHLPAFFISTLSQNHLSLPMFLLGMLALSIIMTWLYLRTQGNLLLMIVVHLVTNFAVEAGLVSFGAQIVGEAVIAALTVAVDGFRGIRPVEGAPT